MTTQPPVSPDPYGQQPGYPQGQPGYPQGQPGYPAQPGNPAVPPPGYPAGPPPGYGMAPPVGQDPETGEPVTSDQKTQAVLAQALSIVGGFLVGLIFRLTTGKRSSFVRAHATAALNVALTQLIATGVMTVVIILAYVIAGLSGADVAFVIATVLAVLLYVVLFASSITGLVLWIRGAMAASRLEPPLRPRFVLRLVKDGPRQG